MASIASFTEALTSRRFSGMDRREFDLIFSTLKKLCLDNADSSELNSDVGEFLRLGTIFLRMARSCDGMASARKHKLMPLEVEKAMTVLLRWKEELLSATISDDFVLKKLEDLDFSFQILERDEPLEYQCLQKLTGDDEECGLGGLALAIAQAEAYIRHHNISFLKYPSLYEGPPKRGRFAIIS